MKKALSILALAALLSACQTAPKNLASIKDDQVPDQARIMVTPMFVSSAPGDAGFAMLFGGGTTPFTATLYDVTGEPLQIGAFLGSSARSSFEQPLLAFDVPPGKRIIMLVMDKAFGGHHVDFAEVDAAAGKIGFLAVSQYGALDRPYLKAVSLETDFLKTCVYQRNLTEAQIVSQHKALGMLDTRGRTGLCGHLSRNTAQTLAKLDSPWVEGIYRITFPTKDMVRELKAKYYQKWVKLDPKIGPYDLD